MPRTRLGFGGMRCESTELWRNAAAVFGGACGSSRVTSSVLMKTCADATAKSRPSTRRFVGLYAEYTDETRLLIVRVPSKRSSCGSYLNTSDASPTHSANV